MSGSSKKRKHARSDDEKSDESKHEPTNRKKPIDSDTDTDDESKHRPINRRKPAGSDTDVDDESKHRPTHKKKESVDSDKEEDDRPKHRPVSERKPAGSDKDTDDESKHKPVHKKKPVDSDREKDDTTRIKEKPTQKGTVHSDDDEDTRPKRKPNKKQHIDTKAKKKPEKPEGTRKPEKKVTPHSDSHDRPEQKKKQAQIKPTGQMTLVVPNDSKEDLEPKGKKQTKKRKPARSDDEDDTESKGKRKPSAKSSLKRARTTKAAKTTSKKRKTTTRGRKAKKKKILGDIPDKDPKTKEELEEIKKKDAEERQSLLGFLLRDTKTTKITNTSSKRAPEPPSTTTALLEPVNDAVPTELVTQVKTGGHVKTGRIRKPAVSAPLRSTKNNLDPTSNRREVKKAEDEKRKIEAQKEDEKALKEKRAKRRKGQGRLTAKELRKTFQAYAQRHNFALPPGVAAPTLDENERKQYSRADKPLHFYVTKIEQTNTLVPRSSSTLGPRESDSESDNEKNTTRHGDNEENEEETKVWYRNGKPIRRKKKKLTPEEKEQQEYARIGIVTAPRSARPWFEKRDEATVEATLRLSGYIEVPIHETTPSPTGSEGTSATAGGRKEPSSTSTLSAQTTEDKKEKPVSKDIMSTTVVLPPVTVQKYKTIPSNVYVHNFRSRFNAEMSPDLYTSLGLCPRPDFEKGALQQSVAPITKLRGKPLTIEDDIKETGILDLRTRWSVRRWLEEYHKALEAKAREVLTQKSKRFRSQTDLAPYILSVRLVWRASQQGFQNNCLYPFVEITTCLPDVVGNLRSHVAEGIRMPRFWDQYRHSIRQPLVASRDLESIKDVFYSTLANHKPAGDTKKKSTLADSKPASNGSETERSVVAEREGKNGVEMDPLTGGTVMGKRITDAVNRDADKITNIVLEYLTLPPTEYCIIAMRVYECDIRYAQARFPADMQIAGDTWITLPAETYSMRGVKGEETELPWPCFDTSFRTIEVHPQRAKPFLQERPLPFNYKELYKKSRHITWTDRFRVSTRDYILDKTDDCIIPEAEDPPPEDKSPQWSRIANYPIAAFDIECLSKKGFPNPANGDPVIAWSIVFGWMGDKAGPKDPQSCRGIVACTRPSSKFADMPNVLNVTLPDEESLLMYFAWVLQQVVPGYLLSYNGDRFDSPYMLDRTVELNLPAAQYWNCIPEPLQIKESDRETKGTGAVFQSDVDIPFINDIDVMRVIRRFESEKQTSYSLNNMAKVYLDGMTKADVHHSDIPGLYEGDPDKVKRLKFYNLVDSLIEDQIFFKRKYQLNLPIMSRVTGIQAQQTLSMGPGAQSEISFLMECMRFGLLKPLMKRRNTKEKFRGATVMFPLIGFIFNPIMVMDFKSLYPSIMIALNLCFSTFLTDEERQKLPPDQYHTIYSGKDGAPTYWAKKGLRPGVIPLQLQTYQQARKMANNDLDKVKKAKGDQNEIDRLDANQKNFKIKSNSIYGLTKQYLEALSATVTFIGRQLINAVKMMVENYMVPENGYTPEKGYPCRPVVRYGDTDSVMCDFGPVSLDKGFEIGKEIMRLAKDLLSEFGGIIDLDFEKIYYPWILFKKKRYSGVLWKESDWITNGTFTSVDKKGSEAVRSDSCRLQKELMTDVYEMLLLGDIDPESASMKMFREMHMDEQLLRTIGMGRHRRPKPDADTSPLESGSSLPTAMSSSTPVVTPVVTILPASSTLLSNPISVQSSSINSLPVSTGSSIKDSAPKAPNQRGKKRKAVDMDQDIIDFNLEEFVSPRPGWRDKESVDYTAPMEKINLKNDKPTPEIVKQRKANVPRVDIQVAKTRMRIARQIIRYRSERLRAGKEDLSRLVLTKALRKKKYTGLNIQTAVTQNMRLRDPGSAPGTGDRVAYLFRRMPKGTKAARRAEEPMHILRTGQPVDFDYYDAHQIVLPMSRLFIPILKTLYPYHREFQDELYEDSDHEEEEDVEDADSDEEEQPPPREGMLEADMEMIWNELQREGGNEVVVDEASISKPTGRSWSKLCMHFPSPDSLTVNDSTQSQLKVFRSWLQQPIGLCVIWAHNSMTRRWFQAIGLGASGSMHPSTIMFDWEAIKVRHSYDGPSFLKYVHVLVMRQDPSTHDELQRLLRGFQGQKRFIDLHDLKWTNKRSYRFVQVTRKMVHIEPTPCFSGPKADKNAGHASSLPQSSGTTMMETDPSSNLVTDVLEISCMDGIVSRFAVDLSLHRLCNALATKRNKYTLVNVQEISLEPYNPWIWKDTWDSIMSETYHMEAIRFNYNGMKVETGDMLSFNIECRKRLASRQKIRNATHQSDKKSLGMKTSILSAFQRASAKKQSQPLTNRQINDIFLLPPTYTPPPAKVSLYPPLVTFSSTSSHPGTVNNPVATVPSSLSIASPMDITPSSLHHLTTTSPMPEVNSASFIPVSLTGANPTSTSVSPTGENTIGASSLPEAKTSSITFNPTPTPAKIRPVQLSDLRPKVKRAELTKKEKKKIKSILNKRFKDAIKASSKILFQGMKVASDQKALDIDKLESTKFWFKNERPDLVDEDEEEEQEEGEMEGDGEEPQMEGRNVEKIIEENPEGEGEGLGEWKFDPGELEDQGGKDPMGMGKGKRKYVEPIGPGVGDPRKSRNLVRISTCVFCKTALTAETSFNGTDKDFTCSFCACDCGQGKGCSCFRRRYVRTKEITYERTNEKREKRWDNCVKCASSLPDAERCKNTDCDYIYERESLVTETNKLRVRLDELRSFVW